MNKSLLIFVGLLAITQAAVTYDTSVHCSCEELNQTECGKLLGYCKWGTTCETVEYTAPTCSSYAQAKCTAVDTYYKCAWETSACNDKSYACADFTTAETCPSTIDCYWNKSGKCASFSSCADYDATHCHHYGCTAKSGTCAELKCSAITAEADCYGNDSETTTCAWTNAGACASLNKDSQCTDLGNYKTLCENRGCKSGTNTCAFKTCADYTTEIACQTVRTSATERTLCAWSGTACADAADTSKQTEATCFDTLGQNYRWADGKCTECSDLVSDDLSSNAVILSVFVALALIA